MVRKNNLALPIITSLLLLSGCGGGGGSSSTEENRAADIDPPLLELISFESEAGSYSPVVVFSSSEDGVIDYYGGCGSSTTNAETGRNTISFYHMDFGTYSDCAFSVTDASGNQSVRLEIPTFTISETDPPVISSLSIQAGTESTVTKIQFHSSESGRLELSGACETEDSILDQGFNEVALNLLSPGTYSDCLLTLIDDHGNRSEEIQLDSFVIVDDIAPVISIEAPIEPVENYLPALRLYSTEAGKLTLTGDCETETESVEAGSVLIPFTRMEAGVYSGCNLHVIDYAGNASNFLQIPDFHVLDTTPPVASNISSIGVSQIATPQFTLESSENGTIALEGDCEVSAHQVVKGANTFELQELEDGVYSECSFYIYDNSSNKSDKYIIPEFTIDQPPATVEFSAWIDSDLSVLLPDIAENMLLLTSTQQDCVWENADSCDNSTSTLLTTGEEFAIDVPTWSSGYFYMALREDQIFSKTASIPFTNLPELSSPQVVKFNDRLWIIGSNIYSSVDGLNWRYVRRGFNRTGHRVIVFKNLIWLIGGKESSQRKNDIWSSHDGFTWTRRVESAEFSERELFSLVEHDGKLWVVGSADFWGLKNDVWYSDDGLTWHEATPSAPWQPSSYVYCISHGDELILANRSGGKTEIWKSIDGTEWAPNETGFENIIRSLGSVESKLLAFTAGADGNRTYSSDDGVEWTALSQSHPSSSSAGLYADDGGIWFVGGGSSNNVWYSQKGLTWERLSHDAQFGRRLKHQMSFFNNRFWIFGGTNRIFGGPYYQDIWVSDDAVSWQKVADNRGFLNYEGHRALMFNDKLYILGGQRSENSQTVISRYVYESQNGEDWQQFSYSVPPRSYATYTVWNDKVWLIGGRGTSGYPNYTAYVSSAVYSSDDLDSWTYMSSGPKRTGHQTVVFQGKLWVFGGRDEDGDVLNTIAYSEDGIEWTEYNASGNRIFTPRTGHQVVVIDDVLYVVGGASQYSVPLYDIWKSTDGLNWEEVTSDLKPGAFLQLVNVNNVIYTSGGYSLTPGAESTYNKTPIIPDTLFRSENGMVNWSRSYRGKIIFRD